MWVNQPYLQTYLPSVEEEQTFTIEEYSTKRLAERIMSGTVPFTAEWGVCSNLYNLI